MPSADAVEEMRKQYAAGIGWGAVKDILFDTINKELQEPRRRYEEWLANPQKLEQVLLQGAEKARAISIPFLQELTKGRNW